MQKIHYKYIQKDGLVKNTLRLFKFNLRKFFYKKNYDKLNDICFKNEANIANYFEQNHSILTDLLHKKYACTNFTFAKGYECFSRDLELMNRHFSDIFSKPKMLVFKIDENYSVYLSNRVNMINEGVFLLSLNYNERALYNLNFSSLEDGLLITCLQGADNENVKEYLKDFTKRFFGLRPMAFLLYFAFLFSEKIGLKCVYGVDDKYAISSFKRGKKRKGRIINIHNLDEIYEENCIIEEQFLGYKKLKYQLTPLEQIASKKRSMYKKRYEFLENLKTSFIFKD